MPALSQEPCETLPAPFLLHGWALGSWNQGLRCRQKATKPARCHSQAASGCQHFPQGLDTDRLPFNPCPRCSLLLSRILLATPESSQGNGCHLETDNFQIVLLKTLESPLDSKEIKPVNSKGNQSWIFIGRTDAEAETPILWPPDTKSWLLGKDPDAGKDWRQEEKGATEDVMVGWHHWLDEHEFEQTPGFGDGQENLACCSSWGLKELDTTERLNWKEWKFLESLIRLWTVILLI